MFTNISSRKHANSKHKENYSCYSDKDHYLMHLKIEHFKLFPWDFTKNMQDWVKILFSILMGFGEINYHHREFYKYLATQLIICILRNEETLLKSYIMTAVSLIVLSQTHTQYLAKLISYYSALALKFTHYNRRIDVGELFTRTCILLCSLHVSHF